MRLMSRMAATTVLTTGLLFALPAHAQQQEQLDLILPPTEYEPGIFDEEPWDPSYKAPRTADGHPSFEGTWTNQSITEMQRIDGATSLTVTGEEAWDLVSGRTRLHRSDEEATDPNAPPPEAGDTSIEGAGGYNKFWIDLGSGLANINGELRTSWITVPESGRISLKPKARQALMRRFGNRAAMSDNPETRTVAERCLASFGGNGTPPMQNALYNNTYVIAQDKDTVAIIVEMVHQPRMIRIGGEHRSMATNPWLGDPVGRWDGDTLVVTTTNFHTDMVYSGGWIYEEDTVVEERFTRVADDKIFYEFTVTDDDLYTEDHKGEMVFNMLDKEMYEYACHEGNYAMEGILAGARRDERLAAEKAE